MWQHKYGSLTKMMCMDIQAKKNPTNILFIKMKGKFNICTCFYKIKGAKDQLSTETPHSQTENITKGQM